MEEDNQKIQRGHGSRMWNGLVLIIAGCLLLADKMGAPIPSWVFTWPMILIAIGLISLLKSQFRSRGALVLLLVGVIFLVDESMPTLSFHNYIWPAALIGVGVIFIMRPRNSWHDARYERRFNIRSGRYSNTVTSATGNTSQQTMPGNTAEIIDLNCIFGGVKRNILSKNFQGGEINAFMGGAEISLQQADIQGPVTLEINNIFGGTKLVVPSNWEVKNEVTAIFGGIEDKRNFGSVITDPNKVLHLKGICIFGGIEISNY